MSRETEQRAREQRVHEQVLKFEAELPALLLTHAGQWIVYLDGPQNFFATEREAIVWALKTFTNVDLFSEPDPGFVVARVEERKPIFMPFFKVSQ